MLFSSRVGVRFGFNSVLLVNVHAHIFTTFFTLLLSLSRMLRVGFVRVAVISGLQPTGLGQTGF